jgi:hypothetical protein
VRCKVREIGMAPLSNSFGRLALTRQLLAVLSESSNSLQFDNDVPAWAIDALLDMRTAARPEDRFAE